MSRFRILLTTTGHAGHVLPMVPFARAWQRAGHDVAFAAPRLRSDAVERAGLPVHPFEEPSEEATAPLWATVVQADPETAGAIVMGRIFAGHKLDAALPGMLGIVERWRPDVIVRETYEYASLVAAERRGIPHVRIGPGLASTEEWMLERVAAGAADVPIEAARRSAFLTLNPAALDDPRAPAPKRIHRFRESPAARPAALPDWWPGNEDPLVYFSFGSVAGELEFVFPHLYRAALDALADLPARILVTIGNEREPEELGPVPPNVRVERWVPQADVAARAAAMVVHGGYGTTLGALMAGVPLVVVPLFADQPQNARRVAELGAGIQLAEFGSVARLPVDAPPALARLGDAVREVLGDPRYRSAARRVAASAAALRPVESSAGVLLAAVAGRADGLAA
jgi:UDP:flavonoid glycosyltransferase YjiC (YdhE family)